MDFHHLQEKFDELSNAADGLGGGFGGGGGAGGGGGGSQDAGPADAGTTDAGTTDAGTTDAGRPDAGRPDAGPPPVPAAGVDAGTPGKRDKDYNFEENKKNLGSILENFLGGVIIKNIKLKPKSKARFGDKK